jgi:hypothetical protein
MTDPTAPRPGDPRPGDRRPDDAATRELIGAWALDALDDADRAAVDDLIARDTDAAREARSLRETAAVLGAAVAVEPPAAVRDAVLELVARTPQAGAADSAAHDPRTPRPHVAPAHAVPPATGPTTAGAGGAGSGGAGSGGAGTRPGSSRSASTRPDGRRTGRRRLATLAAALVVALAVAVPSTIAWQQAQRATEVQARADRLTELLAEPGARVASAAVTSGGTAVAVVTADAAIVTATGVAAPGTDEVYQLWVMRDGVPLRGGTTGVVDGTLEIGTDAYRTGDALALTVEPAGGSEQPTSEPVVVLAPA